MNQLSFHLPQNEFNKAYRRAEAGAARAASRAGDAWSAKGLEALRVYASLAPSEFTSEMFIRWAAQSEVEMPPDNRAWGAVVSRAARLGVIVKTGNCAPAVTSNMGMKLLWRKGDVE